jgi:hypothetical protein
LVSYRDQFVADAKEVVVGMTFNGFILADPNNRGLLDVVGFDTTVPAVIADFVRGYPGWHPDDWLDWQGPVELRPLLGEGWRRAGEGELTDNELNPYQASKARIRLARRSS